MLGPVCAVASAASLLVYFILWPLFNYLRDQKGLRRYPNLSAFAGITDLCFMWEAGKGFRSKRLAELHKTHPVIRIGPNSLSFGEARVYKDIYGHSTRCTKDHFYSTLAGTHYHLADVVDRAEHARKRKVLSSAYAIKNLENWEFKVADKVDRLIKQFDKLCTAPLSSRDRIPIAEEDLTVDYRAWTNFFTMDAIADIGLSEQLGFLDAGNDDVTGERLDGTLFKANYRGSLHATLYAQSHTVWAYPWYETIRKLTMVASRKYRKMWEVADGWNGIVYHRATQRLERYRKGERLDDFFQVLMEDKKGKLNNLEWGEIVAEISIMLNAGSASTAIAINNTMYLLLKNPASLKKLQVEVDNALDEDDVVAPYDKVRHLPYLRACIDESMRILPPTSFGLPRRTPEEGALIGDDFIAGDTSVSMSSYVVHRDEKVFPEPEKYRPERWLEEGGKDLQISFVAFSAGARGCIGRNISYLEQTVLLASLLHRYEFVLPYPDWELQLQEHFNLVPGSLPVKLWRRKVVEEGH
ncbi:hypothetical protein B7463_g6060, partial [Scytalidium lignicola]